MNLEISVKNENNIVTIALNGHVNAHTAPDFDSAVMQNIKGARLLIIDFKECPFVSSAGLRVLMKAFEALKLQDGKIKLINVVDGLMQILHNTYLDDVFDIECKD